MADRIGNWMQTVSGRAFFPLDPRPEDVDINDIAHALSLICRFGGHSRVFYSVAEHSVRVALAVKESGATDFDVFAALMHDAAEAYVGDMVWPLKHAHDLRGYKDAERLVEMAIAERFSLPPVMPAIVKRFDLVLLSTEKRDLMSDGPGREDGAAREANAAREALGGWHSDAHAPLPTVIRPVEPEAAKHSFLTMFRGYAPHQVVDGCPSTP